jgi:integrase
MRQSEITSLRWEDINLTDQTITVKVENTKTSATRTIPMNTATLNLLTELSLNPRQLSDREFNQYSSTVREQFHQACLRTGIKGVSFHASRHAFCSRLVMAGVDIRTVQEFAGHANLNMTLNYSHLSQEHQHTAVKTLDSIASQV